MTKLSVDRLKRMPYSELVKRWKKGNSKDLRDTARYMAFIKMPNKELRKYANGSNFSYRLLAALGLAFKRVTNVNF